jgi:lantibiotic modifying enzyme
VLALAELSLEFGVERHARVLREAARWLVETPVPEGAYVPGLYVGEAGVGAALLRAGQVLGDAGLVAAAARKSDEVAPEPFASPDLFNGSAGRLRFHLLVAAETEDERHLHHALTAGDALVEMATLDEEDRASWSFPPDFPGLGGQTYCGYAHGAAGIGDVLLDLYEATGERRFLATATKAARWIEGRAQNALRDGSGLEWPTLDGRAGGATWCHGASGIGRFLLHAARLQLTANAMDYATRAARMAARGGRWAGPVQCHGLAGSIEFLLDMFQATGSDRYLSEALSLARLLNAFAVERDGLLLWSSDDPTICTPDYMLGYAGVAVCLLRLSRPDAVPHQLSLAGFRRRRAAN